jgi:hypothetical protein
MEEDASMNPYHTRTQTRIEPHELATILWTHRFTAAASLAALERQREAQADAELAWLLTQHPVAPPAPQASLAWLRQRTGSALVRAGEGLAGTPGTAPALPRAS